MKQKDILFILGTSCIIAIVWIIFSIIHAANTSTINQSVSGEIVPIKPAFDEQTITNLQTREQITPIFQINNTTSQASSSSLSTPTLPITQSSTQAATPL